MTNEEYKYYYDSPTKTTKAALDHAKILFCETTCQSQCSNNHPTHALPNTLKDSYKILNHHINPIIRNQNEHPPPLPPPEHPKPPLHIQKYHILYPIHSIIKDRSHTYIDKNKITKKYTSYLCQWESQNTINHNILLLTQYHTNKQHQYFTNILNSNFVEAQINDTRHILPPTNHPSMSHSY